MLYPADLTAGKRNPPNLGQKNSVLSSVIQAPSQVTLNKFSLAKESYGADHPHPSLRRVRQQPDLNPRRSVGPKNNIKIIQARRQVRQQESRSNSSKGFDHERRTISPPPVPPQSIEPAQAGARAEIEAPTEARNSKEFAQAQALAKLEALSVRNSGARVDDLQRPSSPLPAYLNIKKFAQTEALAKLEALSVRNRGTELDDHQRTASPPTRLGDNENSTQAREKVKPESTSSNEDIRFNHQEHVASPPVVSRNNTNFGQRQATVNLLVASSFSTYNVFDPHQSNAPPKTELQDGIEFSSILPKLEARRQASHQAPSSSQVIVSVSPHTKPQRSLVPRDNIEFGLIPPNLQTIRTSKPNASSSRGKRSIHPVRVSGIRRPPRTSHTADDFGSSVLQSARKLFGRSKKGQPGKFCPTIPSVRAKPKGKGNYDPNKKAIEEVSHPESRPSRPDPPQESHSFLPQMTKHILFEKNMSSSPPAQHRAAQSLLDISSPLPTHLRTSNDHYMPKRNSRALPSSTLKNIPEAPVMARDSLSIQVPSFEDEQRRTPEPKLGKKINWRAFLPEFWTFFKESGEIQGMTTEWKWVEAEEMKKGETMTSRGRLERYM